MIPLNSFIHRIFFRIAYWYISTIDKRKEILFMNYGYTAKSFHVPLDPDDEKNRYSIQLYHMVTSGIDLQGKDILEVGSGRGGGLDYICRTFNPLTATGVDLNAKAIEFCNEHYPDSRIKFIQSDAARLIFQNGTFDMVFNIESSHGYHHMNIFLDEVYRVLKPGGFFLFADFRPKSALENLNTLFMNSKLNFVNKQIITPQILDAIDLMKPIREEQISKMVHSFFRGLARPFVAMEGSSIYNKFSNREYEYVFYVLQK